MSDIGGHVDGFGQTQRRDQWWVEPAITATGLSLWLLYFAYAAFQGSHYAAGPYLSPFYIGYANPWGQADPGSPTWALFGYWPAWWPALLSPALVVGFLPGAFRITCYYYRKAYYRAFFGMPPGCAVGTRQVNYRGETGLLLFQNLHRYTLYIAIALMPLLFLDAVHATVYEGQIGVGIGTVMLWGNAILLSCYTFGCHAWRHLIGGRLNCFSCDGVSETRHGLWRGVSWLNARHMLFAWSSLIWIALTDVVIRLMAHGVIPDVNTWGVNSWAW